MAPFISTPNGGTGLLSGKASLLVVIGFMLCIAGIVSLINRHTLGDQISIAEPRMARSDLQ